MIGADTAQPNPLVFEPSAETRSQQHVSMDGIWRVSLFAQRFYKRPDIRRERSFERLRQNDLVIDNTIHSGLLPRFFGLIKEPDYVYLTSSNRPKHRTIAVLQDIVRKGR